MLGDKEMPSNQARPLFERSDSDRLVSVRSNDGPPKYGLTAQPEVVGNRTRLRQAALLVLMALAGSLIFVLPEPNEDGYALSSQQDSTIRIAPETGPGAQRFTGSETGEEGDELALASEPEVSGPTPRFAEVDTSDLQAEAIRAESVLSTTTQAPSAPVAEESTTTAEATTTTAKPAETTVAEEVGDGSDAGQETTDEQPTTSVDGTTESTEAPAPDPETTDTTAGTAEADADGTTPETTVPAEAETTDPPATDPAETTPPETAPPADPAYVDAGHGVMVPPVLLAIRYCESRDDYTAANPSSSARGGYQFLTGSWAAYGHKDRYGVNQAHLATPAQQDEAALLTWERDGTRPWNASKSCWSKRI